jgi:FAS-associated factor 2
MSRCPLNDEWTSCSGDLMNSVAILQEKERSRKSLQEGTAKPSAGSEVHPRYPGHVARGPNKTAQIRAPPAQKETAPSHRTEANTKVQ